MSPRILAGMLLAAFLCPPLHAEDWQHGERILPANGAPADAPVRRHANSPWFDLSNLRKGDPNSLRNGYVVDFKRDSKSSRNGAFDVRLVARGARGRQEYRGAAFIQDHGTVAASSWSAFAGAVEDDVEVWLEQVESIGGKSVRVKVSNSLALGKIGQLTYAREWNADEQREFAELEKSQKPPASAPPATYHVATTGTKLLPGMPSLAGWKGEWKPSEIIDVRDDGSVLLKYADVESLIARTRDWIAIDDATQNLATTDPGRFKPSVKVIPGGTVAVPAGWSVVDASTPIVKGTPLKADWAGRWHGVTVLQVKNDGTLRIRWDDWDSVWDENRSRNKLMITPETLAALKEPDTAEKFAERAKEKSESFGNMKPQGFRRLHDYPIDIPIPKFAVQVEEDTPLHEGTKLGACWGRRWWDVTVLDVNDDDTVRVHWDKHSDAWDGDISRKNLIITKKELGKAQAKAKLAMKGGGATGKSAKATSTGETQFRVVLKSFGKSRINVTKAVADIAGLELKDAKEFVESAPVTVKQNLAKVAAEKIRTQLEEAGGTVAIELQ